jgi:hypothetical protein
MLDNAKALARYIASFFKQQWDLYDYPLRFTDRGPIEAVGRFKPFRWTVQIINWFHMRGDGDIRDEALQQLHRALERHRSENQSLPRPGTGRKLALKFASTERIDAHRELVSDFVRHVIEKDPNYCFVSDESTLWDFHDAHDNADYIRKIQQLYDVDVSDLNPPYIAAIAERIQKRRAC